MGQATILAAGGIVVRGGARPLIAIVQRRKDNGWVLPKGKLRRKENIIAAARREAIEETGHPVRVREFLGAISYQAGGKPKVVQFWQMQVIDGPAHKPMRDIKAVEWLPLPSAIEKLSQPVEAAFLRSVGRRALNLAAAPAHKQHPVRKSRGTHARRAANKESSIVVEPAARPTLLRKIFGRLRRDGAAGSTTMGSQRT
jgi:8-oxo-dGTP diphosphatase